MHVRVDIRPHLHVQSGLLLTLSPSSVDDCDRVLAARSAPPIDQVDIFKDDPARKNNDARGVCDTIDEPLYGIAWGDGTWGV